MTPGVVVWLVLAVGIIQPGDETGCAKPLNADMVSQDGVVLEEAVTVGSDNSSEGGGSFKGCRWRFDC